MQPDSSPLSFVAIKTHDLALRCGEGTLPGSFEGSPSAEPLLPVAKNYPNRCPVLPHQQEWAREHADYQPIEYKASWLAGQDRTINPNGYADPALVSKEEFLSRILSGDMQSFEGPISHDLQTGRPLCPLGRTGLTGRGNLGKWGPNHAADAMVTRVSDSGEMELLIVQRPSGKWAVPGGFVDKGEEPLTTALRELGEETGMWQPGAPAKPIYAGIVRDPRTTDHAWIETSAFHLHLSPGSDAAVQELIPETVGGKPCAVRWAAINRELLDSLYANHGDLVRMALSQDAPPPDSLSEVALRQLSEIEHAPLLTTFSNLHGRVGVFGGSFDPVHAGHLELARKIKEHHHLDAVVFVPASQNPLKTQSAVASGRMRVAMLEEALNGQEGFFVSPVETRQRGPSYSIKLIDTIREELPKEQAQLLWIMGADSVTTLPRWREYERLLEEVELLPVSREGYPDPCGGSPTFLPLSEVLGEARASDALRHLTTVPLPDISATRIRAAFRRGESPDGVPPRVSTIINRYRLYQAPLDEE